MKALKNCIKLRSQVRVYVPTTTDVNHSCDTSLWVESTLCFLAEAFGGATTTEALGAWLSSSGELVKETVHLCYSFASEQDLDANIDALYQHCLDMKRGLKQESVALEVNGEMYFI